jgi:DNA-binding NtrC family response regulator
MTLRAIRVSAALGRDGPERCDLGPNPGQALAAAKAESGPIALVICDDDLPRLDECRDLIVDRGRKHPAKPLAPLLLGQQRIPLIRGGHTSPGQLLRSLRALISRAVTSGDENAFLVGADAAAFGELWARAADPERGARPATIPLAPAASAAPVEPAARGGLFALLRQLPVPESVRERFRGDSPEARLVLQLVLRAARQSEPVLILGDTGTGKEVVARLIHDEGPRRLQSFTAVNCGAIPRELFESELFGYVKGAHSTAKARKLGLWERADGGTLFLDEIADLTLAHQVKILRALEHGEVRPVGAEREIKVDARVVVATNRDLFGMMQAGEFREDLYYRLRSFMIRTPALRDHPEDIPALARHFWTSVSRQDGELPEEIVAELTRYRWPGNARELRMVLSSLFALFGAEDLGVQHLHAVFEFEGQAAPAGLGGPPRPADAAELALHRVECLRHLRRANELVRAVQVALRPLLQGHQLDREALAPVLEQRVSELELLCLQPLLFHGEYAFSIVRRVKDQLHALAESLRGDPAQPLARGRQELEADCDLALSTLFKEVDKLLEAAARRD